MAQVFGVEAEQIYAHAPRGGHGPRMWQEISQHITAKPKASESKSKHWAWGRQTMVHDRGRPNPIDMHVGGRVRLRRTLLGMSQEKLGEAIGLTFQQVQKFERGSSRISARRLFDLARALDVPVGFFFDEMSEAVAARSPGQSK